VCGGAAVPRGRRALLRPAWRERRSRLTGDDLGGTAAGRGRRPTPAVGTERPRPRRRGATYLRPALSSPRRNWRAPHSIAPHAMM
jgi:hypothetical protein